jgi:hypothetical protein
VVADEEDKRESTSIGEIGESPNKTGEGGRDKIGIVCSDSLFRVMLLFNEVSLRGGEQDEMGERWYGWGRCFCRTKGSVNHQKSGSCVSSLKTCPTSFFFFLSRSSSSSMVLAREEK